MHFYVVNLSIEYLPNKRICELRHAIYHEDSQKIQ